MPNAPPAAPKVAPVRAPVRVPVRVPVPTPVPSFGPGQGGNNSKSGTIVLVVVIVCVVLISSSIAFALMYYGDEIARFFGMGGGGGEEGSKEEEEELQKALAELNAEAPSAFGEDLGGDTEYTRGQDCVLARDIECQEKKGLGAAYDECSEAVKKECIAQGGKWDMKTAENTIMRYGTNDPLSFNNQALITQHDNDDCVYFYSTTDKVEGNNGADDDADNNLNNVKSVRYACLTHPEFSDGKKFYANQLREKSGVTWGKKLYGSKPDGDYGADADESDNSFWVSSIDWIRVGSNIKLTVDKSSSESDRDKPRRGVYVGPGLGYAIKANDIDTSKDHNGGGEGEWYGKPTTFYMTRTGLSY